MRKFRRCPIISCWLLVACVLAASQTQPEPDTFFREYAGLTNSETTRIREGKAFAKILDSSSPDQVFVMGAVHINGDPESYFKFATDLSELQKLPGYIAVRQFSDPPSASDLQGFTLTSEDIQDLHHCKADDCEIQLPAKVIEEVQRTINWQTPTVERDVNQLAQRLALEAVKRYEASGDQALGPYRDKRKPTVIGDVFQSVLSRAKALPVYLPELRRYLVEYPEYHPATIESRFYWEKVNFGLKPTLRIVQSILFHSADPKKPAYAIVNKQIYSSHYFQTALDLSVCIRDGSGFYLVTLKGSQQAGLTGLKGSILRKIAVDKTRSSLERALATIKQKLETRE